MASALSTALPFTHARSESINADSITLELIRQWVVSYTKMPHILVTHTDGYITIGFRCDATSYAANICYDIPQTSYSSCVSGYHTRFDSSLWHYERHLRTNAQRETDNYIIDFCLC